MYIPVKEKLESLVAAWSQHCQVIFISMCHVFTCLKVDVKSMNRVELADHKRVRQTQTTTLLAAICILSSTWHLKWYDWWSAWCCYKRKVWKLHLRWITIIPFQTLITVVLACQSLFQAHHNFRWQYSKLSKESPVKRQPKS